MFQLDDKVLSTDNTYSSRRKTLSDHDFKVCVHLTKARDSKSVASE